MMRASLCSLEQTYRSEVERELTKHPPRSVGVLAEADIAPLPPPVQRFLRKSGFVGRPHVMNVRIRWGELRLKRARDADWLVLDCQQFNSVPEPTRIALMKARLGGLVPFDGRDKYQDGHGELAVKLLRLVPVATARGPEIDAAELVTVLSEAFFAPSLVIQPYVAWEALDERRARATLTHGGLSVRGVFRFDEHDDLVRFDTEDRFQDGKPPRRLPWSAELWAYREVDGIRFPTQVRATWHEPEGDFTYGVGTIAGLAFNVSD